jgi:hypothetical protein
MERRNIIGAASTVAITVGAAAVLKGISPAVTEQGQALLWAGGPMAGIGAVGLLSLFFTSPLKRPAPPPKADPPWDGSPRNIIIENLTVEAKGAAIGNSTAVKAGGRSETTIGTLNTSAHTAIDNQDQAKVAVGELTHNPATTGDG